MPIPQFEFDDPTVGLPRRAVPIRFACLATNWTPALLAALVSEDQILAVHEADPSTKRVSDVHAEDYAAFVATRGQAFATALSSLPKNHFVWSDDLVYAFSDHIDLYLNRESAWAEGLGIRWRPALGECASIVEESVDLSFLDAPSTFRVWKKKDTWHFLFHGEEVAQRETSGLGYIAYLLLHPGKPVSVVELYQRVRPPVPADKERADAAQADAAEAPEEDTKPSIVITGSHSSEGYKTFDPAALASIKGKIEKLKDEKADATERGNPERAAEIGEQIHEIVKHLRPALDKHGRPRILGSDVEKARKTVSNSIARAIRDVGKEHPSLAEHLDASIRTGRECSYAARESITWSS